MLWWAWLVLGLLLLGAEMLTPGIFFLFFGASALIVGFLTLGGVAGPAWMQWVIFSAMSVVFLAFFRKPLMERMKMRVGVEPDSMIGELAIAADEMPVRGNGKAELRGSLWNAQNVGPTPLARGQRTRVEAVDGLVLMIRAE